MYVFDLLLEIVIYNKSFAIWNIVNLNPNKAGLFEGIFFRVFFEKSSYLVNDLRNFNEIFRKNVTRGNIKSHKKTGLHPLFRRNIS